MSKNLKSCIDCKITHHPKFMRGIYCESCAANHFDFCFICLNHDSSCKVIDVNSKKIQSAKYDYDKLRNLIAYYGLVFRLWTLEPSKIHLQCCVKCLIPLLHSVGLLYDEDKREPKNYRTFEFIRGAGQQVDRYLTLLQAYDLFSGTNQENDYNRWLLITDTLNTHSEKTYNNENKIKEYLK